MKDLSHAPGIGRHTRLVLLATVLAASFALTLPADETEPAETHFDRYGRPVLDAEGLRYNYTQQETEGLQPIEPGAPELSAAGLGVAGKRLAKSSNPLGIEREWYRTTFGYDIGLPGIRLADLDGDGVREIAVAANGWWNVVADAGNGPFSQVFSSEFQATSLTTYDIDGDGDAEILAGEYDGNNQIRIYDGLPPVLTRTYTFTVSDIANLQVADLDQDGELEMVFSNHGAIHVVDISTGAEESVPIPGLLYITDMHVGNLDDDAALEIVFAGESFSYAESGILDGATLQTQPLTGFDIEFDHRVRLGDLDADGKDEIVGVLNWNEIRIIDWTGNSPSSTSLAYSIPTEHDVAALELADWDGDGGLEIIYGDAQWGSIWIHDGATGALELEVENPVHGITRIAVGDADGDGDHDLVWGGGWTWTGDEHLYVHDLMSQTTLWESLDIGGPFRAMAAADLDLDGDRELLSGCGWSNGGEDGLWFIHDAETKALQFVSPEPTGLAFQPITRIRVAQNDLDPQPEIFIVSSVGDTPKVIVYDGLSRLEELSFEGEYGLHFLGMEVADVDADGQLEVVVATGRENSAPAAVVAEIYDAATGALEWRSPALSSGFSAFHYLRVVDIDNDGRSELLIGVSGGSLWSFDAVTKTQEWTATLDAYSFDVSHDGGLYVGTNTGSILRLDGSSGAVLETIVQTTGSLGSLRVRDFNFDGRLDFALVADRRLKILADDGAELFVGERLVSDSGRDDSMLIEDVDLDGHQEIWVDLGTNRSMMYQVGFTEADAAPSVSIGQPADGGTLEAFAPITLSATANDLVDGDLSAFLLWSSDVAGQLGSGATLEVYLPLGTHVITAEVADSSGNLGLATATVNVQAAAGSVADALARWRFDEAAGTTAFDVTGNGHDATLEAGASFGAGIDRGALALDGLNDHATAAAAAELDSLDAFTATAWVRHERVSAWRSIVDKRDAGSDGFDLYLERSGRGFVRVNSATLTGTTAIDDGAWHHVAGVYDGTSIEIYVDGVLDAGTAASAGALSTSGSLFLGRNFSSGSLFGGEMDDVRLYGRALDASEIVAVYDAAPPQRSAGEPSGLLPSGSGTVTLALSTDEAAECRYAEAPGTDFDSMTGLFTATGGTSHAGDVGPLDDDDTYVYYVRCRDTAGHENGDDFAIAFDIAGPGAVHLGLAGHWPLDEGSGSLTADVSGLGHDGTVSGALWISDAGGTALDFAGSGDAVAVAASPVFAAPETVTMAAWVRIESGSSGWRSIIDVRDGNTDGYDLFVDEQSRAFIRVNTHKLSGQTVLAADTWHHVAAVYDGDRLLLYVDGTLDGEIAVGPTSISTSGALRIGDHFTASGSFGFVGALDELRVYDRVLGPAEIATLANP